MILVTLGTQDKSFERLLVEIDRLIDKKIIKEKVIVQAGYTSYTSDKMEIFDYLPKDEFEDLISKCSCLITHGGVGSIFDAMSRGKKVIAVPRLAKYKEHTNDHQLQVVGELGKEGYILACSDVSDLEKNLKKLPKFKLKEYKGNHDRMLSVIRNYIQKSSGKKVDSRIFRYISFGILFSVVQYLFLYLLNLNNYYNTGSHLLSWFASYAFVLFLYFVLHRVKFVFDKKFISFSLSCLIINFLTFILFNSFISLFIAITISSITTFILSYVVYMLVFGNTDFTKRK